MVESVSFFRGIAAENGFDIRIREVVNTEHFAVLPFEPLVFLCENHNRAVIFIAFDNNRLRDSGVLTAPLKSVDEKRWDNQPAPRLGRTGSRLTRKDEGRRVIVPYTSCY